MKRVFFLVLFFCGMAHAQISPYAMGGATVTTGLGYRPLAWLIGGGVRAVTGRVYSDTFLSSDNGAKLDAGDGHTLKARNQFYMRLGPSWMLGGGISYSKLFTSRYEKSSLHPRVGGGVFWQGGIITADYILTGNDPQNGLHGVSAALTTGAWHHVFYQQSLSVYNFHATFNPANHRHGVDIQALIGVRF